MPVSRAAETAEFSPSQLLPDLPLVMWMVLIAIGLGLAGGLGASELVTAFNAGFGRALGEFALILLPSFALAAALSQQCITSDAAARTTLFASPVAGAGMICPDTAYAALSPAAGRHKLALALGAYSGFKLLYPAGPLIVAAGLGSAVLDGTEPAQLLAFGLLLVPPVWGVGCLWLRAALGSSPQAPSAGESNADKRRIVILFSPFILMASLLTLGALLGETGIAALDFILLPKGALLCAALLALAQIPRDNRRTCLDASVRRTGSLLLLIGAASAFGAVLNTVLPLGNLMPEGSGILTLLALFVLTVGFKLAQGSSMATFAAVAPVAAPIVAASGADPLAAVFAICLGSFIAILPNDSYYWLVRGDALEAEKSELKVTGVLAGATVAQATLGLAILLAYSALVS
ncbi:MAG: permease [Pseudomonadota bacterium]